MISSISNGLRLRKRQIPDQLKHRIRLHHGSVLDLVGQTQAMLFFLSPSMKWDGPLASKFVDMTDGTIKKQAEVMVDKPKPGDVYDFPGLGSGFEKLYIGILAEWDDGIFFEDRELISCYRACLKHAKQHNVSNIAFPALGKDKMDFPHIRFARLALKGIFDMLDDPVEEVVISCADQRMVDTYTKRLQES